MPNAKWHRADYSRPETSLERQHGGQNVRVRHRTCGFVCACPDARLLVLVLVCG